MKHTLYSNYYGWIDEDDIKQELIDCERVENEDEITDEMIWDEMHFLEDIYWQDFRYELEKFFDKGNAWLLTGTLGLWDGKCNGGFIFNTFDEFTRCLKDCDYVEITDEKGHLFVTCSHHDGTNCFEIKRISDFGYEWYNNHCYDFYDEELHTNDTVQEKLSLVSRFGVTIHFGSPDKKQFQPECLAPTFSG